MLRIIYFIILMIYFLSPITSSANIINGLKVTKIQTTLILEITFEDEIKIPTIIPQTKNKEFKIIFPQTSLKNSYISKLPKIVEKIELQKKGLDTEINLYLTKSLNPIIKTEKNKIFLEFKNEENEDFPYKLPPIPQKISTPFQTKKYVGKKISIDLQDADIKSVIRLISEIANVNIILGEEIDGKVTLKIKETPWDQVLDIIMARFNLGKAELNNVIYIAPLSSLKKQTEELNKLKEEMAREREISPLKIKRIQAYYINVCSLIGNQEKTEWKSKYKEEEDLYIITKQREIVNSLLSEKGSVSCDPRTNTLIIKDKEKNINEIEKVIKSLDVPTKQVLIEARIVEVLSSFAKNLGIQWYGGYYKVGHKTNWGINPRPYVPTGNNGRPVDGVYDLEKGKNAPSVREGFIPAYPEAGPLPFGPIVDLGVPATSKLGIALGYITKTSAFLLDLQLMAKEEQGILKIISAPKIITRDNDKAVIRQGYKIPYLELTDQGTATTKFIDADLTLKVIPHILPNNEIRLEINIDKSEPDWAKQVNGVPAILTRSAQTFVRVPNGGTVVIGGLKVSKKQESYGRVPGLSKIPAVGNLFKNSQKNQEEQELLIFITSKVITSAVEEIDY